MSSKTPVTLILPPQTFLGVVIGRSSCRQSLTLSHKSCKFDTPKNADLSEFHMLGWSRVVNVLGRQRVAIGPISYNIMLSRFAKSLITVIFAMVSGMKNTQFPTLNLPFSFYLRWSL